MVLAFASVIAVEVFSSIVHPFPPDSTGTMDEICAHVARYPHWVLGVVVIVWSASAVLSTWVAAKIGSWPAGAVVSLVLLLGLAFNLAKLPYTTWFKVVMPISCLVACYLGVSLGCRAKFPSEGGMNAPGPISE